MVAHGGLLYSHIPTHTRSSDPFVSLLSEKSVPHRYPCEISVTNTRQATRDRLLMWDNIFGAWLYSFENESSGKILYWILSDLSRSSTWFKSKTAHLIYNLYSMLWTRLEHCDWHIYPVVLGIEWLNPPGRGALTMWKHTTHTHFPQQNYLLELLWLIS